MPGIATHFRILELTIDKLSASGNAQFQQIATIMKNNSAYAHLGAVGPALADFIPSNPASGKTSPADGNGNFYSSIWKGVFQIVGGDGTPNTPGLLAILEAFQKFFADIQPILDAEDLMALKGLQDSGEVDNLSTMATKLSDLIVNLSATDGFLSTIEGQIGAGMRPIVNTTNAPTVAPPDSWTAREYLFWQKTGDFTKALLTHAEASGDDRFKAYAYGYISSYAGFVSGSSFVNSIIGGTYRSDWWRYRWIDNFIDTWVYGFYETGATMAGDTPTPGYEGWKTLCNAKLQDKIELPGLAATDITHHLNTTEAQIIPTDFENFWFTAFDEVYGVRGPTSRFKPGSINGAYLMTYLVLWYQTSGDVVGCNPAPPMDPPEGADPQPSWVDPSVPGDNGHGSIAPTPTVEKDADVGKIITGALLALLGLGEVLTGGLIEGGAAIAGGVEEIILGANEINWTKLRSDIYWYRIYLYNGLKALHEIMVLGALQHPYPPVLENGDDFNLLGLPFHYDSALKNCRSQANRDQFPPIPWDGTIGLSGLWIAAPNRGTEEPATRAYETSGVYPNFFIDDDATNPLSNGDIKTGTPVFTNPDGGHSRVKAGPATANIPVQFGNAVANALDLYTNKKFPNWNLDSDRGLAYLTWKFHTGYSGPVVIDPI